MSTPQVVQILFRTSASLRRKIRLQAADEDRSMSEVINSALQFYFKAPKGQGPKRKKG